MTSGTNQGLVQMDPGRISLYSGDIVKESLRKQISQSLSSTMQHCGDISPSKNKLHFDLDSFSFLYERVLTFSNFAVSLSFHSEALSPTF